MQVLFYRTVLRPACDGLKAASDLFQRSFMIRNDDQNLSQLTRVEKKKKLAKLRLWVKGYRFRWQERDRW